MGILYKNELFKGRVVYTYLVKNRPKVIRTWNTYTRKYRILIQIRLLFYDYSYFMPICFIFTHHPIYTLHD